MCVCALVVVNFGLDSFYLETLLLGIHVPSGNIVRLSVLFGFLLFSFRFIFRLVVFTFVRYYVKSIHVDRFKRCWELCVCVCASTFVVYVGLQRHPRARANIFSFFSWYYLGILCWFSISLKALWYTMFYNACLCSFLHLSLFSFLLFFSFSLSFAI